MYGMATIQPEHPYADARVLEPGCPRGERYEWGTGSG